MNDAAPPDPTGETPNFAEVPPVEDFLLDIDEDAERVTVRPIDGLMGA